MTNEDWDLTPTASWGSAWTNTWFEHSSASPATTVLDQADDSQEPELSWETSIANSQGDYWIGDQGVCELPPIQPDNQLGDPTIFGPDGEPIDPAPLDDEASDVLVAAAGDENPIHVGNVPWSRGQWELNLAQLMDGLDWSQHYAVGGGFILDFVGPASLNHTPAKCQFPLEIYRVNQCSNDWPMAGRVRMVKPFLAGMIGVKPQQLLVGMIGLKPHQLLDGMIGLKPHGMIGLKPQQLLDGMMGLKPQQLLDGMMGLRIGWGVTGMIGLAGMGIMMIQMLFLKITSFRPWRMRWSPKFQTHTLAIAP